MAPTPSATRVHPPATKLATFNNQRFGFLPPSTTQVIDVRGSAARSNTADNLRSAIRNGIMNRTVPFTDSRKPANDPQASLPNGSGSLSRSETTRLRSVPTMVLYDDRGLDIFDQITYIDEYYLTNAEIDIFKRYAADIVSNYVRDGSVLVELGCGSMRKTKFILEAISASGKKVAYCAVDLSESSLRASLDPLAAAFPAIRFVGLWGTYDDSLLWIKSTVPESVPKIFLWLGSSIGNLTRQEAACFLKSVGDSAMAQGDLFICGIDRRNEPARISLAYDDPHGLTREFILNGLDHINTIFANQPVVFDRNNFEYVSIYNNVDGRHEAYYRVLRDHVVRAIEPAFSVELKQGELINVEYSYKYSEKEVAALVAAAQFYHVGKWTDSKDMYDLHLFQKPTFALPQPISAPQSPSAAIPAEVPVHDANDPESDNEHTAILAGRLLAASSAVPTIDEFENLWSLWDFIWNSMIDRDNMLTKPINLRHPYIFYIGHLPGFMDIQVSRITNTNLTPPCSFADIFERGIDPDMDDPSKCHPHSVVPVTWPDLDQIMEYTERVRERIRKLYAAGSRTFSRPLARVLFMCYEHDAMHIETFLYMAVQDPKIQPPRGTARPILQSVRDTSKAASPATFVRIPGGKFVAGIDDRESNDNDHSLMPPVVYGWDNESPAHDVLVADFAIHDRPVTVGEYHAYLASRGWDSELVPASWQMLHDHSSSDAARTSEPQPQFAVKTVFGPIPVNQAWNWPVYVSHDLAKAYADAHDARLPTESEISYIRSHLNALDTIPTENVGFATWTPRDVRSGGLSSSSHTCTVFDTVSDIQGNGWELTSTVFAPFDGYEQSRLYSGYSSDFFDGKHNVVLSGSWATLHRIATRKSFRNWYQTKYPFVFAKFRLAKSL